MSYGPQAYVRTSQTTARPREIEAQALLKAARQFREIQTNWTGPDQNLHKALMCSIRDCGASSLRKQNQMRARIRWKYVKG
jgi:flagellar protein FlaF